MYISAMIQSIEKQNNEQKMMHLIAVVTEKLIIVKSAQHRLA